MSDEGEVAPLPEAAIGVSFQIPLENAQPGVQIRMLALQTHLPISTPEGELNKALDLMHRVGDRQYKVRELEMFKEQKRLRKSQIAAAVMVLNEELSKAQERWAQAGNRSGYKAVGREKADFENKRREIESWERQIEQLDEIIERTARIVNASGATDSS